MASKDELRAVRLEKLNLLKEKGINPYPSVTTRTHSLKEVKEGFAALSEKSAEVSVAGRIMSLRGQGAILFLDLFDGTDKFQAVLKKDNAPKHAEYDGDGFALFVDTVDLGDFIQVSGTVFTTKSGQPSIELKEWRMLTKALLPIPDEFYGLKDDDERYRRRYLDLLLNDELRELFAKKAKFWDVTRKFLQEKYFLEVETPMIELTTGGAEARPFKTHHNDFDLDVFFRISVGELWQKRLMAAGFAKTFEIGRVFRNEGSSPEHLQEFTNVEFYVAYMDYTQGMDLMEELVKRVAMEVFGTMTFTTRGHTFNLSDEWKKIDYVSTVEEMTGINVITASEDDMKKKLIELGVKYEGENKERLMDTLWKYCRKQISGPAWLINHPKIVSPLSKTSVRNSETTERFQLILAGAEAFNGFSELNDPVDQRKRFEMQQELIDRGDAEAMMPEWEFVEMLEYGMPPTCGFGFGERLFAFLVDKPIRETQLFPLMKPKE